jgi:hypothetical protein
MELQSLDPCAHLPAEVFVHVLSYLPATDVVNASQVSHAWVHTSPFHTQHALSLSLIAIAQYSLS